MHGYCSSCAFMHTFTPIDVGVFFFGSKCVKWGFFLHFTRLCICYADALRHAQCIMRPKANIYIYFEMIYWVGFLFLEKKLSWVCIGSIFWEKSSLQTSLERNSTNSPYIFILSVNFENVIIGLHFFLLYYSC